MGRGILIIFYEKWNCFFYIFCLVELLFYVLWKLKEFFFFCFCCMCLLVFSCEISGEWWNESKKEKRRMNYGGFIVFFIYVLFLCNIFIFRFYFI